MAQMNSVFSFDVAVSFHLLNVLFAKYETFETGFPVLGTCATFRPTAPPRHWHELKKVEQVAVAQK